MSSADWTGLRSIDELSRLDTFVHRRDPRAMALATLAYVAVVMSYPPGSISALTPLALYPAILIAVGRLPVRPLARRMLLAAPFALAVAAAHPLLNRAPVAEVGPCHISAGWMTALSILLRFVLTISAVLAAMACVGVDRLAVGLAGLGVAEMVAAQLSLLHRYLLVLGGEATRMARAVAARGGGARLPLRTWAGLAGHLLMRSLDRADRIHWAMASRGFEGRLPRTRRLQFRAADAVFLGVCAAGFAAARAWNLAVALGRLTGAR